MGYERNDRDERDRQGYGRRDGTQGYGGGDARDRGFFERAGDEVRSWFGDDEAERRRREDEHDDERIDRERYVLSDRGYRAPDAAGGWYRTNRDEFRRTPAGRGSSGYGEPRGYDGRGDRGVGPGGYGSGRDRTDRYADDWQRGYDREPAGRGGEPYRGRDEHGYGNWRDRQMSAFDRDYDEYRRENQSRFETEFAAWRQNRQTQRDALGTVKEHQEVVGADGAHVGTVDHVRSDHILLTKTDKDAGGHHHAIPSSWITSVGETVQLSKTADEAKRAWREADGDRGGRGQLDRSFGGTY